MNEKSKISEKILNAEKLIEKEEKIKALQSWHDNIINYSNISDYEREYLIHSVEKKIRLKFPHKAKKILGGKSAKAQELLEEIFKSLKQEFDWSKNKIGTRVKVGGDMIAGRQFVVWYISYKNESGFSTGIHYRQNTPETDPILEIDFRKVGKDSEKYRDVKILPVELKDDALKIYKEYLKKIIN